MSKIPTIAMIPSGYKANKLYSVLPTNGDGDLTTSRASTATRVNKNGLIEAVATGVPRLDYTNGGCPSLLVEPQSTNLVTYSEDFSDASWAKTNATITSNSILSPKGDLTADLLKGDGVGAFPRVQDSVSSSGVVTYSFFAKKEASDEITLFVSGTGIGGSTTSAYTYTFSTDSFAKVSGGDADVFSSKSFNDGWVRLQITFTTTTITDVRIYPQYNNTSTDGVYIWGAQVEEQSYATSYIPTSGATATRVAETLSKSGLSNYINSSEGVLYAEISALADDETKRYISLTNGGVSERITIGYETSSNTLIGYVINSGVFSAQFFVTSSNIADLNKVAIKFKQNDFSLWVNGVEVATDNSGDVPVGLSAIDFSRGSNTDNFYGKLKDIRVYNEALSDSELQTLTS